MHCHKKAWIAFQVNGKSFLSQMEASNCLPVLPADRLAFIDAFEVLFKPAVWA